MRFIAACFIILVFALSDTPISHAGQGITTVDYRLQTDYGWVDIQGSSRFVDTVSKALVLLANRDLDDFKMVVGGGIKHIVYSNASGVDTTSRTFYIADGTVYYPDGGFWLASDFVHERWHILADEKHMTFRDSSDSEHFALSEQRIALVRMQAPGFEIGYIDKLLSEPTTYQLGPRTW